jgi:hypothetical protein
MPQQNLVVASAGREISHRFHTERAEMPNLDAGPGDVPHGG